MMSDGPWGPSDKRGLIVAWSWTVSVADASSLCENHLS
jgi:hypothetical protein